MRRRDFITCLSGAAVTWPLAARAQQRDQIPRVGVLINSPENVPQVQESLTAFRKELGRLGWSEGHNIRFDIHFTQGDMGRIQELARAMAASQPDVILVHTTTFVAAMQKQTSTIPIVFVNASDPIGSGFVASLARPGGNLTGLLLYENSIVGKWLGILKEIAPQTARVAFVANPKVEIYAYFLKGAQRVAPSLRIEVVPSPVQSSADIERVIGEFARGADGGLFFPPNLASDSNRDLVVSLAAKYRLPAVYGFRFSRQRVALCPTASMRSRCSHKQLLMSIASCTAKNRPTFRCKLQPNTRPS
jgi:putative tryptophan/tyrosine transport system substrate-binding protein